MKKILMLAIISIFILSSCTNNNINPVNTDTIPAARHNPRQSMHQQVLRFYLTLPGIQAAKLQVILYKFRQIVHFQVLYTIKAD